MSIRANEAKPARTARVAARMPVAQKALLQHAADLLGQSLSEFVVTSARVAAEDAIRRCEVIHLCAEDSLRLAEALLNPPPPNEKLRALFAEYPRSTDG